MNKICFGCGVKLQSTDPSAKGYIPEKRINDASYCMRCFRMIHYGEVQTTNTPKDKKELINKINKDDKFVVFLTDFLNINEEVVNIFKSIKKKKVLVINKCELLPDHINKEKFASYIKNYYGINDEVKIKGGNGSHGARLILNYLERNNIKETYLLGISNSGKSTLINDLIKLTDSKIAKTTVNNKSNTTVDFIRVKLNNNLTLIDSPGFILDKSLNNDVSNKDIIAYSLLMKDNDTIGLLDKEYFVNIDKSTPIVFYSNAENKSVIKKVYKNIPELSNKIEILEDNMDIIIFGVGFITIKKKCTIRTNIDLSFIEIRKSMLGDNHEDSCNE